MGRRVAGLLQGVTPASLEVPLWWVELEFSGRVGEGVAPRPQAPLPLLLVVPGPRW